MIFISSILIIDHKKRISFYWKFFFFLKKTYIFQQFYNIVDYIIFDPRYFFWKKNKIQIFYTNNIKHFQHKSIDILKIVFLNIFEYELESFKRKNLYTWSDVFRWLYEILIEWLLSPLATYINKIDKAYYSLYRKFRV